MNPCNRDIAIRLHQASKAHGQSNFAKSKKGVDINTGVANWKRQGRHYKHPGSFWQLPVTDTVPNKSLSASRNGQPTLSSILTDGCWAPRDKEAGARFELWAVSHAPAPDFGISPCCKSSLSPFSISLEAHHLNLVGRGFWGQARSSHREIPQASYMTS